MGFQHIPVFNTASPAPKGDVFLGCWGLLRLAGSLPPEIFAAFEELRENQLDEVHGMVFSL